MNCCFFPVLLAVTRFFFFAFNVFLFDNYHCLANREKEGSSAGEA
jgi:hypothetical protein